MELPGSNGKKINVRDRDRKKRIPLGGLRQKLQAPEREGFHRCWVNEENVDAYEDAGYEFVCDDGLYPNGRASRGRIPVTETPPLPEAGKADIAQVEGIDSRVCRRVGSRETGDPQWGYLMEVTNEIFREDERARDAKIAAKAKSLEIPTSSPGGVANPHGSDGMYVPTVGANKITTSLGRK